MQMCCGSLYSWQMHTTLQHSFPLKNLGLLILPILLLSIHFPIHLHLSHSISLTSSSVQVYSVASCELGWPSTPSSDCPPSSSWRCPSGVIVASRTHRPTCRTPQNKHSSPSQTPRGWCASGDEYQGPVIKKKGRGWGWLSMEFQGYFSYHICIILTRRHPLWVSVKSTTQAISQ